MSTRIVRVVETAALEDIIKELVADPTQYGRACEAAAVFGRLDFIKYAHFRTGSLPYEDFNPLELAAAEGHYEVVKYLVEHTVIPFNRSVWYAECAGHSAIAEYLRFMD